MIISSDNAVVNVVVNVVSKDNGSILNVESLVLPVTMRDVAQKAGVSIKTVSRVVNNQGELAESTRERVLAIIEELDYRPNRVAQGLATQRTFTVGLVVGDITNPFFPEVARGAQDAARTKGYELFLCNSDGDPEQERSTLQSLADHAVDGIIIYPSHDSEPTLTTFAENYKPLVVINSLFEQPDVSHVVVDTCQGAKLAVNYLIDKGHTAIGMVTGVQDPSPDKVRRVQGYREALLEHNLPVIEDWIIPGQLPSFECGYQAAKQLLSKHAQITAIFAYNDLMALGAIRACNELGRSVPADCAIIGYDDIPWAETSTPALTTIRINKYELGQQAMTRLLVMLNNPDSAFSPIHLDVELVVRESA